MRKYIKGYSRDKIIRKKLGLDTLLSYPNKAFCDFLAFNRNNNNFSSTFHSQANNSKLNKTLNYNTNSTFRQEKANQSYGIEDNNYAETNTSDFYRSSSSLNINKKNYNRSSKNVNSTNYQRNSSISEENSSDVFKRLSSTTASFKSKSSEKKKHQINAMIPSQNLKELKDLEECTFRPKITQYSASVNINPLEYNKRSVSSAKDYLKKISPEATKKNFVQEKTKEINNWSSLAKSNRQSETFALKSNMSQYSSHVGKGDRSKSSNNYPISNSHKFSNSYSNDHDNNYYFLYKNQLKS